MTDTDNGRKGWATDVNGTAGEPEGDKLILIRHDPPQVFLDIVVPGLRSAGKDQRQMGREAIQEVITALQEALDSPSALAGFRPD